jgi:hypothetical protein
LRWVLAVGLAACGVAPDHTIDITHDVCSPLAIAAPDGTAIQRAGLDDAIRLWAPHGAPRLAHAVPATLEIRFEPAAPAFHGYYDDERGIVFVNSAIEEPSALAIVIAHELGHAFGLAHVPRGDRSSVMNPGNLTTAPNTDDELALEATWGRCDAR